MKKGRGEKRGRGKDEIRKDEGGMYQWKRKKGDVEKAWKKVEECV